MNNSTIWYSIQHSDYPHCAQGQTLVGRLPAEVADTVADKFLRELQFVTGLTDQIKVWVD